METSYLRDFVVLAQYLNFTSAAKTLSMSQSTLSRHVADLERSLGAELVTHTERVALTPAGEALLDEVDALLAAEDRMIRRVAEAPRTDAAPVKIEEYPYSQAVTNFVLDAAASTTWAGRPIQTSFVPTKGGLGIEEAVSQGYFDLGVAVHLCRGKAAFEQGNGVVYLPIPHLASRLCFYLDASNPVLGKAGESGIPLSEMREQRFVLPLRPEWGNFKADFTRLCREEGFEPGFVMRRTHGMTELGAMDMRGLVLVITDADVVSPDSMFLKGDRCRVVRCSDELYAQPALVYKAPCDEGPAGALVARLEEAVRSL